MLLNRNIFTSDKRAQSGPVGTLATLLSPRGVCHPLRGSGVHAGGTGSSSGSSSSLVACPQRQGAEVTAQILNFVALPRGL